MKTSFNAKHADLLKNVNNQLILLSSLLSKTLALLRAKPLLRSFYSLLSF